MSRKSARPAEPPVPAAPLAYYLAGAFWALVFVYLVATSRRPAPPVEAPPRRWYQDLQGAN